MVKENTMKQTEIGLLPEDWKLKFVKEFTDCTAGGTPSTQIKEFWNGNIPWMNSGELNKRKVFGTENYITQLGLDNSSTKLIPPHCILIGLAGQGKTRGTVAMNMIELSINQSVGAFYPNSKFSQLYLYYNLQNRYDELRQLSTGDGGRGGLNLQILKSLQIPFPPFPEQEAIAEALSDADAWIESLEQLIAKKRLIKLGAMQELLTPKEDWVMKKLGEVLIKTPDYGLNAAAVKYNDELPNYLRITDIGDNGEYLIDGKVSVNHQLAINYFLDVGDICIARTGASVGKSYYHNGKNGKLVFAGFLIRLKANTLLLDSRLLFYITKTKSYDNFIISNSMRSGQPGINSFELQSFEICIPKSLTEQIRIATILSDMDAELKAMHGQLTKARQVKQGMMQELLTGRVRLV